MKHIVAHVYSACITIDILFDAYRLDNKSKKIYIPRKSIKWKLLIFQFTK